MATELQDVVEGAVRAGQRLGQRRHLHRLPREPGDVIDGAVRTQQRLQLTTNRRESDLTRCFNAPFGTRDDSLPIAQRLYHTHNLLFSMYD